MGYQSGFLRVIPLLQVDCIRVTHPCAGRRQRYCYLPAAPRLACVRPVASVHPEPGSNSSLYSFLFLYYTFEASPDRIDFFLSSFLYYTCFFNSFNELGKKFPGAYPVSSFAVAKLIYFPIPLQIFLPIFYAVQHNFFYNELYYTHLYLNIFFKKIPILFK